LVQALAYKVAIRVGEGLKTAESKFDEDQRAYRESITEAAEAKKHLAKGIIDEKAVATYQANMTRARDQRDEAKSNQLAWKAVGKAVEFCCKPSSEEKQKAYKAVDAACRAVMSPVNRASLGEVVNFLATGVYQEGAVPELPGPSPKPARQPAASLARGRLPEAKSTRSAAAAGAGEQGDPQKLLSDAAVCLQEVMDAYMKLSLHRSISGGEFDDSVKAAEEVLGQCKQAGLSKEKEYKDKLAELDKIKVAAQLFKTTDKARADLAAKAAALPLRPGPLGQHVPGQTTLPATMERYYDKKGKSPPGTQGSGGASEGSQEPSRILAVSLGRACWCCGVCLVMRQR
jgi:hypothetical protein